MRRQRLITRLRPRFTRRHPWFTQLRLTVLRLPRFTWVSARAGVLRTAEVGVIAAGGVIMADGPAAAGTTVVAGAATAAGITVEDGAVMAVTGKSSVLYCCFVKSRGPKSFGFLLFRTSAG
jgi:hypothetical protein